MSVEDKKYFVEIEEDRKYIEENEIEAYEADGFDVFEEVIEEDSDQLDEFKADGENSSVAEPVGGQTPTRKADKRNSEAKPFKPGSGLEYGGDTKAQMYAGIMKGIKGVEGSELKDLYNKVVSMSKAGVETYKEDFTKVTADDIDISEHVNAMFKGQDLDEAFVTKATSIFETAVITKVNEVIEEIALNNDAELEVAKAQIAEKLEENVNDYLNYVVNEWKEENELAISSGIKNEMVESFLGGLKDLFIEHHVNIPEDKVDLVAELSDKVNELEEEINNQVDRNVDLINENKEFKKQEVLISLSEDLTDLEFEKFAKLVEGLEYSGDDESFENKAKELRESYFGEFDNEVDMTIDEDFDNDNEILTEETDNVVVIDPSMANYVNKISESVKK